MELKKSPKANLEGKRPYLIIAGAIVALSFSLVAFEWRTPYEIKHHTYGDPDVTIYEIEDIPVIIEEDAPKPEELKPEPPKQITDQLDIVDDKVAVSEEPVIENKPKPNPFEGVTGPAIPIGPEPKVEEIEDPIPFAQIPPKFKCIKDADQATLELLNHVQGQIKYPWRAQEAGISGKVHARFVVDKEGKVTNIEIVRGLGYGCDEEVVRVLKSLPDFCPGFHNGKYRATYFTLPVHFKM